MIRFFLGKSHFLLHLETGHCTNMSDASHKCKQKRLADDESPLKKAFYLQRMWGFLLNLDMDAYHLLYTQKALFSSLLLIKEQSGT